jgi:hypothetical protein
LPVDPHQGERRRLDQFFAVGAATERGIEGRRFGEDAGDIVMQRIGIVSALALGLIASAALAQSRSPYAGFER